MTNIYIVVLYCLFGSRGVRLVVGAVGNFPSVLDSESLGFALGGVEACEASHSQSSTGSALDQSEEVCASVHQLNSRGLRSGRPMMRERLMFCG